MTSYRRNFVPGGSFFFTVNLADRRQSLLTANIDLLRAAFREIRRRHPFTIDAIVILPEHLHTVWTMPDGDADFATRWRQMGFAALYPSYELPVGQNTRRIVNPFPRKYSTLPKFGIAA